MRLTGRSSPAGWPLRLAILGMLSFWVIVMALGSWIPDYDQLRFPISVLTTRGAPFARIAQLAFLVLGVAVLAFALGLHRSGKLRGSRARLATTFLVIHGLGRLGEGVFALGGSALTTRLHTLFGMPTVLVMLIIPFAVGVAASRGEGIPWMVRAGQFGLLFLAVFVVGVAGPALGLAIPLGLGQRVGFVMWYGWLAGVAVQLLREER